MLFFYKPTNQVVMLGRLTWLECRLWLAVAGITRLRVWMVNKVELR